jgi:hypothetical protein
MRKDKITAMWEEDGDLMCLKNFFAYIYQNNNLKDRIKSKTLEKIAVSNENYVSTTEESEAPEAHSEQYTFTSDKRKKFLLISGLRKQLKSRKNALKIFSVAAVAIFAIYLGTSPLFTGDNSPLRVASGKAASEDADLNNKVMPQAAGSSIYEPELSISKRAMEQADFAYSTNESIMLQKENSVAEETIQQKIIYVLEVTLKTDNVSVTLDTLQEKVTSLGGYIAESRQNNTEDQTSAFLSLRIPVTEFDSFKGELSKFGTVSNQHLFTDDVTRQYFDVETRLRSWEAQEKRYLEILQQAKTVDEILKIEDSLANVRREMESLKGQLKYWDNRVQYSEIRINIYPSQSNFTVTDPWQPVSLKSTFHAAKNAVIKSISFLWNSLNYFVVFIGYAIPIVVLLAIIWFFFRRYRKSK